VDLPLGEHSLRVENFALQVKIISRVLRSNYYVCLVLWVIGLQHQPSELVLKSSYVRSLINCYAVSEGKNYAFAEELFVFNMVTMVEPDSLMT
jgi:hypothetical protein